MKAQQAITAEVIHCSIELCKAAREKVQEAQALTSATRDLLSSCRESRVRAIRQHTKAPLSVTVSAEDQERQD